MNAHTRGPWHVDPTHPLCIENSSGNIALVNLARASEADARLIAAAPDLVIALQRAALCLDDMETANAMLKRDMMAATCLVISNEIRNALIKAGVNVPPVKAGL